MVLRCGEDMWEELLEYLRGEPVYNTFLPTDISNFGFDKEFQNVYTEVEEDVVHGVCLTFYQSLILYSQESRVNREFLKDLFARWTPTVVMGRSADVKQVTEVLPEYRLEGKSFYLLEDGGHLATDDVRDIRAVPRGEDKLYEFLMEILRIRTLYGSKEMIGDRLENGDGVHFYREENGHIIAQVNSTVKSEKTVIIDGVATLLDRRGGEIVSALVSRISRGILEEEKTPCLFYEREEEHDLYARLGFQKIGMWAALQEVEKKLPSYVLVYNQLYQDLMDGVYKKDSLLPSENALAATYKVSRNALRQALVILCQDGCIYKHQGKGAYVSYDSHKREEKDLCDFLVDCAEEPVLNVTAGYNFGKPTLIVRGKLKLEPGEGVLASSNVYWGEGGPVGQASLQIPVRLLNDLGIQRDSEEALVRFVNEQLYQQAATGEMIIQAAGVGERVVPHMKIEEGTMLLYIEQILFGREGWPLARVKYYFLSDKYKIDYRLQA